MEASAAAEAAALLRRLRGQSAAAQAALARQQREEAKRLASQAFHLAQALHKVCPTHLALGMRLPVMFIQGQCLLRLLVKKAVPTSSRQATLSESAPESYVIGKHVVLMQVFNNVVEPPDTEFGCFAALYGPRRTRFEKEAILRADIGAGRTGRGKPLPALIPVSRSDVTR